MRRYRLPRGTGYWFLLIPWCLFVPALAVVCTGFDGFFAFTLLFVGGAVVYAATA